MKLFSPNMIQFIEDIGLVDLFIYKTNLVFEDKIPFYKDNQLTRNYKNDPHHSNSKDK